MKAGEVGLLGEKKDLDVILWSMGTHRRGTIGSALPFFFFFNIYQDTFVNTSSRSS